MTLNLWRILIGFCNRQITVETLFIGKAELSHLERDFLEPLPDLDLERDFRDAADPLRERERDFLATDPSLADGLRDFELFLLGERDFPPASECADALLPLLELAFPECSLPLRDLVISTDFERLRDFLAADCGEADRDRVSFSAEASISTEFQFL